MTKKLIIGLGTGRCGSLSLCYFLNAQPGIKIFHEGTINYQHHPLMWDDDHKELLSWLNYLEKVSDSHQYFGDIGMYFLPYVSFLIDQYPDIKFICIKRGREAVIQSYLRWTKKYNHWYNHDGRIWKNNLSLDAAFPKFNEPDKAKAIGLYWDMYYEEIERLIKKYPQQISCFPIECFNYINGRNEILDFLEYQGQRSLEGDYKKHKQRTASDNLRANCLEVFFKFGRNTLPKSVRHWLWINFAKYFLDF
jgi:hypothetical protein